MVSESAELGILIINKKYTNDWFLTPEWKIINSKLENELNQMKTSKLLSAFPPWDEVTKGLSEQASFRDWWSDSAGGPIDRKLW